MSTTDWTRFNTPAHLTAQHACRHVIHCAVDGHTRAAVSAHLDAARPTSDPGVLLLIAQLSGPCCLPPAEPNTA
ncbi:hypothetical protein [Cryptosporangium minutisporangium]|uniref:Uncharacterized protein n=1 Tax=Cryptosporangium minutisporangium TaxID=113569 RepID=A0ABP6SW08_9ACTN